MDQSPAARAARELAAAAAPRPSIGALIARELAAGRSITLVRAKCDPGGIIEAQRCEWTEDDRSWFPGWDQTPYRVIGPVSL